MRDSIPFSQNWRSLWMRGESWVTKVTEISQQDTKSREEDIECVDKTLLNLFRPKQTQTEGGDEEEDGGECGRCRFPWTDDEVELWTKARLQSATVAVVAEVSVWGSRRGGAKPSQKQKDAVWRCHQKLEYSRSRNAGSVCPELKPSAASTCE